MAAQTSSIQEINPSAILAYVATHSDLTGTARNVLTLLAKCVDWSGPKVGSGIVRVRTLAAQAGGCSTRTIQRALLSLEQCGEIEREERKRSDGSQACSRYRLTRMLTKIGKPVSPPPDTDVTPYPSSVSVDSPNPPKPCSSPPPKAPGRPKSRSMGEEKPVEELEKIAEEALRLYEQKAMPHWTGLVENTRKARLRLAQRILRLGGLEKWKRLFERALTSSWIKRTSLGVNFFTCPETAAAIEAGRYGVAQEERPITRSKPLSFSEEQLRAQPWLAYAADLERHLRSIPSRLIEEGKEEANRRGVFGRAAEAYAVWRHIKEGRA